MHNCRQTRNGLIDLVLDELPADAAKQLLSGLNDCVACREEYATLRNTWRVSGQAMKSLQPTENFWPGYHARLNSKLIQHLQEEKEEGRALLEPAPRSSRSPWWLRIRTALVHQTVGLWSMVRQLATTSIRVPIPAALALMLLFGISILTLRPRGPVETQESTNATPSEQLASVEARIVQVPVIQERVVTRVVYVEKQSRRSTGASNQVDRGFAATKRPATAGSYASAQTAVSLAGFKPTDQVKLSIIKGNQDEK